MDSYKKYKQMHLVKKDSLAMPFTLSLGWLGMVTLEDTEVSKLHDFIYNITENKNVNGECFFNIIMLIFNIP